MEGNRFADAVVVGVDCIVFADESGVAEIDEVAVEEIDEVAALEVEIDGLSAAGEEEVVFEVLVAPELELVGVLVLLERNQ